MAVSTDGWRGVADWLVHCADPLGPRASPPARNLSSVGAWTLVQQASLHGVLPAVARHFPPFAEEDASFARVKEDARGAVRASLAFSRILRGEAESILAVAQGIPLAVVKGPVFARTIYPEATLRPFTDIDLLTTQEQRDAVAAILVEKGYRPAGEQHAPERQESQWTHRDNEELTIDLHTDLIHAPSLRGAMSLRYEHIAAAPEAPATLLLVAVVHGAWHLFERLQQLVDMCQAARALPAAEEARFEELVQRTNARFGAIVGLELAGALFGEPRCREIARALGAPPRLALARMLITQAVVTTTMSHRRVLHSWRRDLFRELIKWSAPAAPRA